MFNIKEIWKATNTLVRYYGTPEEAKRQQSDSNGIERLSAIQVLYRELRILGVFPMFNRMRSTKEARDILWGRDFNTARNQKKLLKKLSDKEWLQSLPPNTLGAHIGHMFNNFTIEELYEKRFNESEQQEELFADVIGVGGNAYEEMRVNLNRHFYLTHDLNHALFRYDTSSMGESCVQGITAALMNFRPMKYVGLCIAARMALHLKTWEPFGVYFESEKLGKRAAAKGFFSTNPSKLLEMDIAEIREKYDIGVPVKYKAFCEKYHEEVKMDNIHPEYDDVEWDTTEYTI